MLFETETEIRQRMVKSATGIAQDMVIFLLRYGCFVHAVDHDDSSSTGYLTRWIGSMRLLLSAESVLVPRLQPGNEIPSLCDLVHYGISWCDSCCSSRGRRIHSLEL